MGKRIIGLALLIVLGIFVYLRATGQKLPHQLTENFATPSPTPTPFYELTIPALRARTYTSNLGELQEYTSNSSYTSYLTSYGSDGLKINGLLTKPKGAMPQGGWPAIVFVHGYIPPSLYKTTERYVVYVDALARAGFVVFKIDLRGHGSSEGEGDTSYYSDAYVIDSLNARAALTQANFVNPSKIGMWGHSMAGNIVFRDLVIARNIPVVVIWAGAVYTYEDFDTFSITDKSYRPPASDSPARKKREELFATYGRFSAADPFWRQIVPTNYLDGVTGAVQVHHAQDDAVVPIGYSRNLMSILDKTTIPHELDEYPTGGHNIDSPSFAPAMSATIKFFQKYLGNTN